ncbi:DUF4169 family protein [Rhizorhabdus argentea]|uniref:DUF4169 family protein n=1 Tax=Rhizorhabdus argentea TaxID=1387174 RepID=UPI0030EC9B64
MGDLVNLNKARKAKGKLDARVAADANRVKFGRMKAEKDRDKAEAKRATRLLDGAKLERD